MRVLIQLRSSARTRRALAAAAPGADLAGSLADAAPGLTVDAAYEPVEIPAPRPAEPGGNPFALAQPLEFSFEPEAVTQVVRGEISDAELPDAIPALMAADPDVVGVFSDPLIESMVCPKQPVGDHKKVASELDVSYLKSKGMDGRGVQLAIVDSGINKAHLESVGQKPKLDTGKSWNPAKVKSKPGKHPVDHGTMCAFDAGIAAPEATFLDYALLLTKEKGPTVMSGYLSDGVAAYGKLLRLIRSVAQGRRRMVVSNSWGMFSPKWDFPIGHPGNYSDNPAHPFNVIVASLERQGADILFAAGNCGRSPCIDGRCDFKANQRAICGANSHPKVLSVAGIDTKGRHIGYSSEGPGRLAAEKPDISAYTEFTGSMVYGPADGGTSAACPVAAGVVAAVRSKYSAAKVSPAKLRSLIRKTADDLGGSGYDQTYGWGAIDPRPLAEALAKV
jgi:subtilisin family serine protease